VWCGERRDGGARGDEKAAGWFSSVPAALGFLSFFLMMIFVLRTMDLGFSFCVRIVILW
jgi:hypothetical protein